MFDGFRNFGSEQQRGSNGASSSNGGSSSTSRGKKRTLEELFKPPLDITFKGDLQVRYFMRFLFTLEFQIDHTVGKNLHGWKNDIDNGARATEMCPDIKAIGIWLAAIESL